MDQHAEPGRRSLPWDRYKATGWGRDMGREAIDLYTETKVVRTSLQ